MPNAHRECNRLRVAFEPAQSPDIGAIAGKSARNGLRTVADLTGRSFREPRRPAAQRTAERFEPFAEPALKGPGQFFATGRVAIKGRPPFDEGPVAIDDGRDAQGGLKAGDRQRCRAAEFVSLRPLDVGLRQQPLPNVPVLIQHTPDRPDRIARLAVLDLAFAGAADPDRIAVEIANDFPHLGGGLFEHGAVIGFGHLSIPSLDPVETGPWARKPVPANTSEASDHTWNRLKFPGKPPLRCRELLNHHPGAC